MGHVRPLESQLIWAMGDTAGPVQGKGDEGEYLHTRGNDLGIATLRQPLLG
jgi:hypothetical protein